jgi:predicted kinase
MNIAIFGLPGSGKTFLAKELAKRINGLHISSDIVRKELKQRGKYNEKAKFEVYRAMLDLMDAAIKKKQNVVLDATFYKENIRGLFKEKAGEHQTPLYFIEMRAAESVIKERVDKKRPDSEADFEVYLKVKSEFEPLQEDHLVLYPDQEELDKMLDKALAYTNYRDEKGGD